MHQHFYREDTMASKTSFEGDINAFLDHFKALPFDLKKTLLTACQEDMQQAVDERLVLLEAERAELLALTGRPSDALNSKQAEEGRTRPKAAIAYYDPETGNHSTGRGGWKNTPWVKAILEAGGDIEQFRVGPNNPLPEHLQ